MSFSPLAEPKELFFMLLRKVESAKKEPTGKLMRQNRRENERKITTHKNANAKNKKEKRYFFVAHCRLCMV
jgi:hypothetical protein